MAYPCYAWYHRAYAHFGFNLGKTPMPEVCPIYYWFDAGGAERDGLAIREPSFLRNPRTPANVSRRRHAHPLRAPQRDALSRRRALVEPRRRRAGAHVGGGAAGGAAGGGRGVGARALGARDAFAPAQRRRGR